MAINALDELKAHVRAKGWRWKPGAHIPYGEQIIVTDGRNEAPVSYWPKRESIQVQGKESWLKTELQAWLGARSQLKLLSPESPTVALPHMGLDESGKGDWFGGVVVAAVYADEGAAAKLRAAGVRDSKLLEASTLAQIADAIQRLLPAGWVHVNIVSPADYNRQYESVRNINALLARAFAQTAKPVWTATRAKSIVCDQFSHRSERLQTAFASAGLPRPLQQHHAESVSVAVAAASVLATAAFANQLAHLGLEAGLGEALPKGSSDISALEGVTKRLLRRGGAERLANYAKLNFAPVRALIGERR